MSSPVQSLDGVIEAHEVKSDPKPEVLDVPLGEQIGRRPEDHDLSQFGYKAELERRFGLWSMIGLSCTIMCTWEAWFTAFGVALTDGGRAGAVYGFLFCWLGYTAVIASLSELVSMVPTASGQYTWAYLLSPPKYRKFVSYITGWQIVLAWQADLAACFYLSGTIIQGLMVLNYPDYHFQRYHATLILWAVIIVGVIFNTTLAKLLPLVEGSILICHCLGFFVVLIPIVYFGSHASAADVFAQYESLGGYTDGTAWFVGLIATVWPFLGADGAIHMSEEVQNARVNVPNALMASVTINGLLAFGMMLAILFTVGDLDNILAILTPVTGIPFIDYFYFVLNSKVFATGLSSLLTAMFVFAGVAVLASTSRVTWAFARDNGILGSSLLKKVHTGTHLPLWSIALSALVSMLLSLINIGSSVAFNAIVSLTVACYFGSYAIPIALLVWKRVTKQPVNLGPWNMGRYGLAVNIVSLCWLTITWIFAFFPIAIPVTLSSMNWSSTLWGGFMAFGLLWYFFVAHKCFTGPNVRVDEITQQ